MIDGWLKGKVLVIIGGSSGLGLAAAIRCVEEGAKVVVVGRDDDKIHSARDILGNNGLALMGDAMAPETAVNAIAKAAEAFGGFHGLYHVAGGSGRRFGDGPLHQMTEEGWMKTLHWNLDSVMLSNRAAVNYFMEHQQSGVILNMSSVLGFSPSPKHFATHAYAAAKAGIIGFSKSLASYYANLDIRINVIAPGLVETPMSQRAFHDQQILDFIATKQPLRKGVTPKAIDLADTAVYLLSDRSALVTGQVIAVDGGWTVSEGQYA
jgi:NAD(P)-dependent dehydrogenase (short-subunit alcohol dehydrogenase family)